MSTQQPADLKTESIPSGRTQHWLVFGLANLAAVCVLSLVSWYLLVDPDVSPLDAYPQPYGAYLFWGILVVVWLGFCLEFSPFERLVQPMRGIVIFGVTVVIAFAITIFLAHGWGAIDNSFSARRDLGAGYGAGSLWVLFGFLTYVMSVVNWNHWPWTEHVRQPWLGLAEISLLIVPTSVLYGVFALPTLVSWLDPAHALMTSGTATGWFYAMIVSSIVTGTLLDNWPWRLAGSPVRIVLASTIGNLVVGTGLFFAGKELAALLIGSDNSSLLGAGITTFPAQIGVCWVFWAVMWSNAFGNWPTKLGKAPTYVLRVAVTLALGIATFCLYYFLLAKYVLHEPPVVGSPPSNTLGISGNALGWMDWMIFWALIYILCFDSFGLRRPISIVKTA